MCSPVVPPEARRCTGPCVMCRNAPTGARPARLSLQGEGRGSDVGDVKAAPATLAMGRDGESRLRMLESSTWCLGRTAAARVRVPLEWRVKAADGGFIDWSMRVMSRLTRRSTGLKAALELGFLTEQQFDEWVNPDKMIGPGE